MSISTCVHVYERKSIQAKETNTVGEFRYLVALAVGGLTESPEIEYRDYQIINANNSTEAKLKYDEINKCSFYYGEVLGEINSDGCVFTYN